MFAKNWNRFRPSRNRGRHSHRFEQLEQRTVLSAAGWTLSVGGDGSDWLEDAAVDADGNVYAAGHFSGEVDLNGNGIIDPASEVSQGGTDLYLSKHSPSGDLLWSRTWELNSSIDNFPRGIDVTGSTVHVTSNGGEMWKLDTAGNTLANHSGFFDPRSVVVDAETNVYMSGFFSGTIQTNNTASGQPISLTSAGDWDVVVAKFNEGGKVVWAQRAGGQGFDWASTITLDNAGHAYLAGEFAGTADFGDDVLEAAAEEVKKKGKNPTTPTLWSDAFVSKIEANNGTFVWTTQAGGVRDEEVRGVAVGGNGEIYFTGSFGSTAAAFGSETITKSDDTIRAGFVAKLDGDGTHVWARSFEGDQYENESGDAIATDSAGNVLVVGTGGGNVGFGQFQLPELAVQKSNFLTMLASDGSYLTAFHASTVVDNRAFPRGLVVDHEDNAYVPGRFNASSVTFATGETITGTLDSSGDPTSDTYLMKLSGGQPSIVALRTSVGSVVQGDSLSVSADGAFVIGGAIQSVAFYRDADGDGVFDSALDELLENDADVSDAWSVDISTAGLAIGTHTLFAQAIDSEGHFSSSVATSVEVTSAPADVEIYVFDIRFDSKRGGKDWRAVIEVRDVDDNAVQGVTLKVDFAGTTYNLETDSSGIARTDWERNLASGDYYANAYDLALAGYSWDPFSIPFEEDDSDGDGKPDDVLTV